MDLGNEYSHPKTSSTYTPCIHAGDRLIDDQEGTAMWLRIGVPFRDTVLFLIFIDFTLLWRPFLSYSSAASTVTNPLSSISVTKRLQFNTLLLRTCRWDLV